MQKKLRLAPGIDLVFQPKKQFKTINITVSFIAKAEKGLASKRSLLSYMLSVASKSYPNQQAVSKALIQLFGANYQTKVLSLGDLEVLTSSMQIVQPNLLPESSGLLADALNFLKSMVFDFDWQNLDVAEKILLQERKNLVQAIQEREEDKMLLALDQTRLRTFSDQALQDPIIGTEKEVMQLSLEQLKATHQQMLADDRIIISVVGDLDYAQLEEELLDWPFEISNKRETVSLATPALSDAQDFVLQKSVLNQAVLVQNYIVEQLTPNQVDLGYFQTQVFNTVFGAGPASRLFTQIREKHSLAYNISSRIQTDTGLLTVVAGFDSKNQDFVKKLLQEQIDYLANGQLTLADLKDAQKALINDFLIRQDSPAYLVINAIGQELRQQSLSESEYIDGIQKVTLDEVLSIAKLLKKQVGIVLTPEVRGKHV